MRIAAINKRRVIGLRALDGGAQITHRSVSLQVFRES